MAPLKPYASADLSMQLGKDPRKTPKCSRFAKPPIDITASVMKMREVTRARQALRTRSWEAAFPFTRKSLKMPKFERFACPPGNIIAAVQEMRSVAAARRARKQRSWAAAYSLNKQSSKSPQFERFANPQKDIRVAVEEMRESLKTQQATKNGRSWTAAFSLNKQSSKTPQFERFANHQKDIRVAVDEMRKSLQAKQATKKARSWAAAFSLNKLSSKTPQFERFANPQTDIRAQFERFSNPQNDIRVAVEEMRDSLKAKQATKKGRSWAAAFSLNKQSSKTPQFERFGSPQKAIKVAVEEMRESLKAKQIGKKFVEGTRDSLKAKQAAKKERSSALKGVLDTPKSLTCKHVRTVRLPAPPMDMMKELRFRLQFLLCHLEYEVSTVDDGTIQWLERKAALPEPFGALVSQRQVKPLGQDLIDTRRSWTQYCQVLMKLPTEQHLRNACVYCERLLKLFQRKVELCKKEQREDEELIEEELTKAFPDSFEVDKLIEEELTKAFATEDQENLEADQLIEEELTKAFPSTHKCKASLSSLKLTGSIKQSASHASLGLSTNQGEETPPSTLTTWFAGSPALAARQLRRTRSTPRVLEPTVGARSAMAMDLGCILESSTPRVQEDKESSRFSLGPLQVSKSKNSMGSLQPLVTSSSCTMLPAFSKPKTFTKNQYTLSLDSHHEEDPCAWGTHTSFKRCSSVGAIY